MRALRPPLLVCIDFQREYAAHGRPLCIAEAAPLLARAARLLQVARSEGWIVAHALMRQDGQLFGTRTEQAKTLEGFEPWGAEMVFSHQGFSAYGNKDFTQLLDRNRDAITLMMGIGGPFSLLHTLLDAYSRHDEIAVIEDVVGSPAIGPSTADDVAATTLAIAGSMHRLVKSDAFTEGAGRDGVRVQRSTPTPIGGASSDAI